MRSKMLGNLIKVTVFAGALLSAGVSSAADVEIWLRAQYLDKQIDNGSGGTFGVDMWGFASCTADFASCDADAQSPGPQIDATSADTLTINVDNTLNAPVSIIIPGQAMFGLNPAGGDPVPLASEPQRNASLTHETAPHSTGVYSWSALRTGTYLYQSGTMPSLQVPMGLYGALVVRTAGAGAPYADIPATDEVVMLFSEVDPVQNARLHETVDIDNVTMTEVCVPIADYAASMNTLEGYPCSVDYYPALTLLNGERTFDTAASSIEPGDTFLLRMLNAGQRTHVAALVGVELSLIAEDGGRYPGLPRVQTEAALAAGKTMDALVATEADIDVTYNVFDRMPSFSNEGLPNGGAIGGVVIGTGTPAPTPATIYAVNDVCAVPEDAVAFAACDGVLANDVGLAGATVSKVIDVSNGTLNLAADGTFTYSPDENFSGTDTFSYRALLGGQYYPAQVNLDVSFANDAPVANDDGPYINSIGATISVDALHGVLGNDSDPDGDSLTASICTAAMDPVNCIDPPAGLTLYADGSFEFIGVTAGDFTYTASDGTDSSEAATASLMLNPVANIALNVHGPDEADNFVTSYRWIVQEDATFHVNPAVPDDPALSLSTNFHKSYMPVVAQGCVGNTEFPCLMLNADVPEAASIPIAAFNTVALDPSKFYYVSVLPNDAGTGEGHSIGGAQILPGTMNSTVEVIVNNQPIPTAQISVIIFEDNGPTNGVPDGNELGAALAEAGLGGFEILLEDAAGRYGQAPGFLSQDAFGNPLKNSLDCFADAPPAPTGVIVTCPDGKALIKDLPPGKFGVIAVPPAGTGTWTQTSTIEGTNVQDTWVKAGEPPFLVEFGAPGYHAFIGFVNPDHIAPSAGSNTIDGNVTMLHSARAPDSASYDSGSYETPLGHTRAWVGLNSAAGTGPNIATVQADPDGHFTINNIPNGTHQLVIWDEYLDQIIFYQTVVLPGGGNVGNIPVPTWFGRHEHTVFLDENENGLRDPGEAGLPDQNVNLRFRDGTIFQSFPTDTTGFVPFDQIFPFGAWQVAEVDFLRHRATGIRVWVDGGGDVSGGDFPGLLNPQAGSPRNEMGPEPYLLEGFQSMPGMTSIFEWGKKPYAPGENGGIAGIVFYGSTRGENDPRLTVGDTWEPGIPHVKVRLYREIEAEGGGTVLTLVDETTTDSWDDNLPEGCEGESATDPFIVDTLNGDRTRCFDGVRNFEQARPGALFDGGYAFDDIPPGAYVVEVVPPTGYEVIKEEDKNVDFGDAFEMAPVPLMFASAFVVALPDAAMVAATQVKEYGLTQPPCVGPDHVVPDYLSLFPGLVDTYAPYAMASRPLCNRKRVILSDQSQGAADFHLFTSAPVAGQFQGLTTDDVAVETNPASPQFSDKWGPAYLPISMRDFKGNELYRMYTDQFGHYNGLVPSTFTANSPIPSGYSPAVHQVCLNDPGNGLVPDPLHNPNYGTFCYTLMYMPGTTTYLDTPLLPLAAFAAGYNPVDCALPDNTPVITNVNVQGEGNVAWTGTLDGTADLIIHGLGNTQVPNPAYEGPLAMAPYNVPTIQRNYGFGAQGPGSSVTLNGVALNIVSWNQNAIRADIPGCGGPVCSGELVVTRNNGNRTVNTVTFTVSGETPIRVPADHATIQDAIDAASPGDLILVEPGIYDELVIMWKPVRLQGAGSSTIINAVKNPPEKLDAWRQKILDLLDADSFDLLPGQPAEFDLVGLGLFSNEMGAGITVVGKASGDDAFANHPSRIDGFTITGADGGGGIFVNGYADNLVIANNHVTGNSGVNHGGVRIGLPNLPLEGSGPFGLNSNVSIHDNAITLNGGQGDQAVAGGIAICTGTDNYALFRNYVCGNFNLGDAGGIGHLGLSDGGQITANRILFNQTFNQGLGKSGGGLFIGGEDPIVGALTLGSGDVLVDGNLIQGNQAGSGHGGGIRLQAVNGEDASSTPWSVTITNNMVINNVAAWAGAGISMLDAVNTSIVNNTIANNDSTATAGALVAANLSTPQPAGISAEHHSVGLADALGDPDAFSDPELVNNIVWHNRSFTYDATAGNAHLEPIIVPGSVGGCAGDNVWDLGVLGEPQSAPALKMSPSYSVLTSIADYGGANNVAGDPAFLNQYCNGARTLSSLGPMQVAAEVIEGGNFIDVRFGPLTTAWPAGSMPWNYHISNASAGLDNANGAAAPAADYDGETRPQGPGVDRGADEVYVPGTVAISGGTNGFLVVGNTLAFGNQPNGANVSSTVTVSVSGNPVTFGVLSLSGSNTFGIGANNCSNSTVAAGGSCQVTITFSGQGGGAKSATLSAPHNGAGSPSTLLVTGT